jgi:hypothetical protein
MSLAKHSPAETVQKLYKNPKKFPAKRPDTGHFLSNSEPERRFPQFSQFCVLLKSSELSQNRRVASGGFCLGS